MNQLEFLDYLTYLRDRLERESGRRPRKAKELELERIYFRCVMLPNMNRRRGEL